MTTTPPPEPTPLLFRGQKFYFTDEMALRDFVQYALNKEKDITLGSTKGHSDASPFHSRY